MASAPLELSLILLLIAFFGIFVGGWVFTCWILSHLGGWHRLAKHYRRERKPTGKRHSMASAKIGLANYNNCLTMHSSPEGLSIAVWPMFRIGHPPLLIPWSELNNPDFRGFLWFKYVVLEIGSPKITTISFSQKDFAAFQQQAQESGNNIGEKL